MACNRKTFAVMLVLVWTLAPAGAVPLGHAGELDQIARSIAKEPQYHSKPKYCLLVFGLEAKTRCWIVVDGNVLYVDRACTGDLTAPAAKVVGKPEGTAGYVFEAGDIRDGDLTHTGLKVESALISKLAEGLRESPDYARLPIGDPSAMGYTVSLTVAVPGRSADAPRQHIKQYVWLFDDRGTLRFSDDAAHAPIIHFAGPLTIATVGQQSLVKGITSHLITGFGTRGLGPGTFAFVGYDGIVPKDVFPVADIEFRASGEKSKELVVKVALAQRC
jgi:hypothetical protein